MTTTQHQSYNINSIYGHWSASGPTGLATSGTFVSQLPTDLSSVSHILVGKGKGNQGT